MPYTSCVRALFSGVFSDVHVIPFRLKIFPKPFFNARLDIYSWLAPKDHKLRHLQREQSRIFAVCPKQTVFGPIFTEFVCLFWTREWFPEVCQGYSEIPRIILVEYQVSSLVSHDKVKCVLLHGNLQFQIFP